MPDDSNGVYSLPTGTIVSTGDNILPSQHNPWANDNANAMSNRFSKDGRAPATGNWNLNNFRITGLGTPVATTDATTKAYVDGLTAKLDTSFLKGLLTSKSSAYVISVSAGSIRGNGQFSNNLSPYTKNLNASWVAGSGNGGRMSAAALAASTTYHLHALSKISDGSFDWGFDVSATAPTIPTGYTWVGRFWSVYTNTTPTAIIDYNQVGNECYLAGAQWFSSTTTIADALYTLPVTCVCPSGISVAIRVNLGFSANSGGSINGAVFDAASFGFGDVGAVGAAAGVGGVAASNTTTAVGKAKTNTSRQLRASVGVSGSGTAVANVGGWEDYTLNRIY